MRSIFEDTEVQANLEDAKKGGNNYLPYAMWFTAIIFIVGTWSVYRWVDNRPAPEPPPPPVSLADVKQTSEAFSKFNRFAQEDNWAEAEKLLSVAALQKLKDQNKSLRDSVLGERKNDRVVEAASTPSGERTTDRVRQDNVYKFADGQYIIVPLALIMENGKLVIDGWSEQEPVK
ncbi:MAG: hypothetical protein L0226_02125 [Acidobacteria bacterium]|nr:hypothetical protein [Acidobacteriota bacterium]